MTIKKIFINLKKYKFLLNELIKRDFKVKYQRSALGMLWSILYPLLMMAVMGFVFSNFFKASMPGVSYLAYLLTGLTLFNFFSDATNQAMPSIVGNMGLINKVYIPKYIFPLSKVLFSFINFLLTLIPLYGVILLTGTGINIYHLLLPYCFLTLTLFCLGFGFFLSCVSVFVRDIFYIWGIIVLAWTYLTPIMYNISMLEKSALLMKVMQFNPLYQYIDFARQIILYNKVPSVSCWVFCGIWSLVMLVFGCWIFRKNQNKFIYYI